MCQSERPSLVIDVEHIADGRPRRRVQTFFENERRAVRSGATTDGEIRSSHHGGAQEHQTTGRRAVQTVGNRSERNIRLDERPPSLVDTAVHLSAVPQVRSAKREYDSRQIGARLNIKKKKPEDGWGPETPNKRVVELFTNSD